jgi:hypothetical protein
MAFESIDLLHSEFPSSIVPRRRISYPVIIKIKRSDPIAILETVVALFIAIP